MHTKMTILKKMILIQNIVLIIHGFENFEDISIKDWLDIDHFNWGDGIMTKLSLKLQKKNMK